MDFLDGSDVDEDTVGDVDQDAENVLLGSDDDEASSSASKITFAKRSDDRGRSREDADEDVLKLVLQDEEEELDYEDDEYHGVEEEHASTVFRSSLMNAREPSQSESENMPSTSTYGNESEENFQNRRYVEEDDYDEADDDSENRNTRSRFTSERKVDTFASGGHAASASNSMGIPIQTVGERKTKPGTVDTRPKHWNHNGPPRPIGPRHQGRNQHRFPNPRPPMDNLMFGRPNMVHPPIVQFNEGIFTDFNQPIRPPKPRQPLPGRLEPRNLDHNPHPAHPQNHMGNNRPQMPPQNVRPPFGPVEGHQNMRPPRMPPPPGGMGRPPPPPQPQQHPRPDFNSRPQRQRFPPNNMNMNHRNTGPPLMNHPQGMGFPHERPPFPPRHQQPPFRPDLPPHAQPGMGPPRHPNNAPGFPPNIQRPAPHNMPPQNYMAPQQQFPQHGNMPTPRMEVPHGHGGPQDNPFFMPPPSAAGPSHYNTPPRPDAYHPDGRWGGEYEQVPPQMQNPGAWMPPPNQHQAYGAPGYAAAVNSMYDHSHLQPANPMMHHGMAAPPHPQMPITLQPAPHLEVSAIPITSKSIYIKPNSEIHEALSKGNFLPQRGEPRREGSHTSSSSRYYDDQPHHHDRERPSTSSRRGSPPPSERRRDEDDYYDDRRSYREHDRDRRPRRKYEESRRHRSRSRSRSRSNSPERKYSRTERPVERSRDRDRRREEGEGDRKESGKLLEEAKKMGLGEEYVKKLEEQKRLREKILKTKEQRRKQGIAGSAEADNSTPDPKPANVKGSGVGSNTGASVSTSSGNGSSQQVKENEADSAIKGGGKSKKILRIVKDKTGKVISRKVVVIVGKQQQEGQQQ